MMLLIGPHEYFALKFQKLSSKHNCFIAEFYEIYQTKAIDCVADYRKTCPITILGSTRVKGCFGSVALSPKYHNFQIIWFRVTRG